MMKKTILIDLSHIGSFCGFGNICDNFGPRIARADLGDVRLVLMVPERFVGIYGDGVEYITRENRENDLKKLNLHIDLWHATDQLFEFRKLSKGTKQLLTVHDLNFLHEKKGIHRLKHIYKTKWRIKNSDHITTISHYVKDDVLKHINPVGKSIDVIYNGIQDIDMTDMKRPAFIKDDNEKFFFTIGQIREKKNFHKLVPMMKYFPDYKLYICGDDHFKFAKDVMHPLVEKQGDGRVFLSGKITNAEKNWMYAHAQAFLFPSKLEGFGLPVLEAMRFGCRVFSSTMSSLPEVCGEHACYFQDMIPENMADTVKQELPRWDKNGQEALAAKEYSEQFTYDKYTQQYAELYKKLLND